MADEVILEARLDSAAAEALRGTLLDRADRDVVLDASQVDMLGGLCLELLLSAQHHWAATGHGFAVLSPSDNFIENLGRFGLEPSHFGGPDR